MDSGRREYTFLWSIENYSYQNRKIRNSPVFKVKGLGGTAWYLQLNPKGFRDVSLSLCRNPDSGPESVSVHCEMSVLGADGSTLSSAQYDQEFSRYLSFGLGEPKFLEIDEEVLRRDANYLPRDVLTLCCKISKAEGNVRCVGQCSARTRIKVEKVSFVHKLERFSTIPLLIRDTITIPSDSNVGNLYTSHVPSFSNVGNFNSYNLHPTNIPPFSNVKRFISSSLYSRRGSGVEEDIVVEIAPSDANRILHKCELYLLDAAGNAIECNRTDSRCNTNALGLSTLILSLTRQAVLNRRSEFLPNDQFSLLCKCTFSAGLEFETIEETVHEMPLAAKQKVIDAPTGNARNVAEKISSYPSALDDLKALYLNQSLTDVELKTKTKLFKAHKAVLCSRSPVFNAMLSINMKEKNTSSIKVDDLEEDVVQRLLLFLYSDSIDEFEWKMAARLYYAADKYEVGKLKEVCSSLLLANLDATNAGDLLLLADTHSDADLKKSVEDFILKNEVEVFGSDEWERLMETNPVLVMKTMHLKYKRRRLE